MLSAYEVVAGARSGKQSPRALVEACLAQIDALEPRVRAWAHVDHESAIAAADKLSPSAGLLAGLPVGLKDIFDVAGHPTGFGSGPAFHTRPERDSTAAARLRAAGAIILGKTATTQFAQQDPSDARNPWDLEHTPGGSSSGSAAAVAAGMVPAALGSQTVGSVLRPAAYCGVVGLKPSYGRISVAGVHPLAPSFDHVGIFGRNVRDVALLLGVLAGPDADDPTALDAPVDDYLAAALSTPAPPRLGLPRTFFRNGASDEVARHVEAVAERLSAAGASVIEIDMPAAPQEIVGLGDPVFRAECAAVHAQRFAKQPDEYRPNIHGLIERGLATSAVDYIAAKNGLRSLRAALIDRLSRFDALLLPTGTTTAPLGLASTGNAMFCAPASFSGLPSISLPSGLGEGGLPLAVQLVAPPLAEASLLATAAWLERVLDFHAAPALTR